MEEVIVTVHGTQTGHDGETDRIELIAKGHRQYKNGIAYITYKEELSGMENTTTLLKLFPDHVSLVRIGAYEQRQDFCPGSKTYSMYITPYGSMKLGVYTRDFNQQPAGRGDPNLCHAVSVSYELEIDGQWQSSNTLTITVSKV